jgi:two-component system OmpR family response regulator
MEEVLARLRALIRRSTGQVAPALTCGDVTFDARSSRVMVRGKPVKLTSHELRVLSYLMHQRDRIVSQGELMDHIYAGDMDRDSNTVEVFVARLRRKLGAASIETVRGAGYRMSSTR